MAAKKTAKKAEPEQSAPAEKATEKKTEEVKKAAEVKTAAAKTAVKETVKKAAEKKEEKKAAAAEKKETKKEAAAEKKEEKKAAAAEKKEEKKADKKAAAVKKPEVEKKSFQEYKDVINWKKWEAHNMNWLYIEINAGEIMNELEAGVNNIKTVYDAMLDSMLEGDAFIVESDKPNTKLTVRYYCDNLSEERRKYSEVNG